MTFTVLKSFNEIVNHYDGFILDQYGVMHNGKESLQGAVECVEKLSSMGKKLIILSNTSSPALTAIAKLPKLGFDPEHFIGAVTSGEEASRFIRETYSGVINGNDDVPTKAIFLTWADNVVSNQFLEKCQNLVPTTNFEEADLVIAHGSQIFHNGRVCGCGKGENESLGSFMEDGDLSLIEPILRKCKENDLKMICANPDYIVKVSDGSIAHMPGKIAKKYQEMGGECTSFGKPHEEHFNACLRELELDASRVAHVGDSLHHDIAGANAAGISSIFITGGIHSESFTHPIGEMPDIHELNNLFGREGGHSVIPSHVAPLFKF